MVQGSRRIASHLTCAVIAMLGFSSRVLSSVVGAQRPRFLKLKGLTTRARTNVMRGFSKNDQLQGTRNRYISILNRQSSSEMTGMEDEIRKSTWQDLGVECKHLVEALETRLDITFPNSLQTKSTKCILHGNDVILSSYTGSGKTLAGLLPLLERLLKTQDDDTTNDRSLGPCRPILLVVTPTRELSLQILRVLEDLLSFSTQLVSVTEDEFMQSNSKNNLDLLHARKQPNIVVSTPKELLLMLNQDAVSLDRLQYLMIDEVDLVVDTDKARLNRLIEQFPSHSVQKVLASASALAHPEMKRLVPRLLAKEHMIITSPDTPLGEGSDGMSLPPTLKHTKLEIRDEKKGNDWATSVKNPDSAFLLKFQALLKILRARPEGESTLVFVNKKSSATRQLLEELRRSGVEAELLSGTRRIQRRNIVTWQLMEGEGKVVVATDEVAARGLDYESVTMVINFDLPYSRKNYLHRAGRAGRAGRTGMVISMVSNAKELKYLDEKLVGSFGAQALDEVEM